MSRRARNCERRHTASYWPQASITLGLLLGLTAAVVEDGQLAALGGNLITLGAAYALQRRRNERRSEED